MIESANQKTAGELYHAINGNDVESALKLFDPQVVRIEFEDGTYNGLAELEAHIIQGRNTWAEGSCSPEEFISNKDKLVVLVHVHVRQKDKTEWIDARVADGLRFRNGRIIEFRSFMKKEDALNWAEVS